jgi:NAD(P)H-hydrate epimerase
MSGALPDWCEPLPDAARVRAADAWAIGERGIPGLELMERAGQGIFELVMQVAPSGTVAVVCGKGYNGGDGYVVARLLRDIGREVVVLATAPVEELRGDARHNAERLPGAPAQPFTAAALTDAGAAVAVDALLGTGFEGEPRGAIADAITALNDLDAPVVAVDVPSGVDASTGEVAGVAVRAAATATFHAAKPGLWIAPGKGHAGAVHVIDIGIPADAPVEPVDVGWITDAVLEEVPRRGADSTKFTSGHVLVAGGAPGLTGAPTLAAEAAMRAGAGYVTVCVPQGLRTVFDVRLVEVMKLGLPDGEDGGHCAAGVPALLDAAEGRGGAVVLGCGIGRGDGAVAFAREAAARLPVALVLDADGLNAHAGRLAALRERDHPTILTPHAGELGRLLDRESAEIGAHRLSSAREAAAQSGAVVVLKGDDTLVAAPDGTVAVSPGGAPGLATAGTGDVLAGACGALLAVGLEPFTATCAAVHAHLLAGRAAAAPHGPNGVIASDVIAALPAPLGRAR